MTAIKILLIIIAVYAVLFAGPAVASFFNVYGVKRGKLYNERAAFRGSYLEPYFGRMDAARAELEALPHGRVTVTADDGATLCADYYDASGEKTAILLHGYNAHPLNNFALIGRGLAERGFNLLAVYARAHEPSGGKHGSLGVLEQYDLLRWIGKAKELGGERILVYGMSMGGATVAYACDKIDDPAVRALVVDCAFESPYDQYVRDCKKRFIPWFMLAPIHRLLGRAVLGCDLKTPVSASLENNKLPVLFIHGGNDTTVPPAVGEANYAACSGPKRVLRVDGAQHTLACVASLDSGDGTFWEFLDESLGG